MKKDEIPQDPSKLDKFTKELYYATDESGKYTTGLSRGWEIKNEALGIAWEDIQNRIEEAKTKVERGEASPILFFMELRLMDLGIVSAYTGFWQWQIKRHFNPQVFHKLSTKKLKKYAEVFDISVEELQNMQSHGN